MALSLDTWYKIAFSSKPKPDIILVSVSDYSGIANGAVILEMEVDKGSPLPEGDGTVSKCRMEASDGSSLALCSDGQFCLSSGDSGTQEVVDNDVSVRVTSPVVSPDSAWLPLDKSGNRSVTLYFTCIDSPPAAPCENDQATQADSTGGETTVGAYPAVFSWADDGSPKGKKVKVIWRKDI